MTASQPIQLDFRVDCPPCGPSMSAPSTPCAAEPAVVRPRGDFGSDRAAELEAMLRAACENGRRTVIVDLSAARLMSAAALGVLVRHRRRLRLRRVPASVERQLTVTKLAGVLPR